jgi:hypothetical protein
MDLNKTFIGIIKKSDDPLFLGRCKIMIPGIFDGIPDDDLPWCFPQQSTIFAGSQGFGSFSYPKLNTPVRINFQNGDLMSPEYSIIEDINEKMQSEIKESYENAQVLVYDEDEDLKIIFTKNKGLFVWLKSAFFNITPGGADIIEKSPHHYIDCPDVQVGHSANHPDTKCDKLFELLNKLASAIDSKYGAPSTCSLQVQSAKEDVCSEIVKIA